MIIYNTVEKGYYVMINKDHKVIGNVRKEYIHHLKGDGYLQFTCLKCTSTKVNVAGQIRGEDDKDFRLSCTMCGYTYTLNLLKKK